MTEHEFLERVYGLCAQYDVMYFHDNTPRRNVAGFPDLVLVGRYHTCFVEVKADQWSSWGSEQRQWKWKLLGARADYRVWYYAMLDSGDIARALYALSQP
jgi:hypothetical protein